MIYSISVPMIVLPTAYYVVGGLLILIALVAVGLFLLKQREVASLKKEVAELRDTMRMMRYEEANLSRMLHTVDKTPSISLTPELCEGISEESVAADVETMGMEIQCDDSKEDMTDESVAEVVQEEQEEQVEVPAETLSELPIEDATPTEPELVCEETVQEVDEEAKEELAEETVEQKNIEEYPTSHKQAINERRPAIPHDLFSAWFAENEEEETEEELALVDSEYGVLVSPCEESHSDVVDKDISSENNLVCRNQVEVSSEKETESSATNGVESVAVSGEQDMQSAEPVETTELSKEDERFCRKLERIVNTRMKNSNLNIDIIASQFGMGRTNFYRKVRERMGMSPNDYLRKCRMERAAEIIRTTNLPIADICAQVGIPDAQYFSRVFKTYFGSTPSAYREQNSEE